MGPNMLMITLLEMVVDQYLRLNLKISVHIIVVLLVAISITVIWENSMGIDIIWRQLDGIGLITTLMQLQQEGTFLYPTPKRNGIL